MNVNLNSSTVAAASLIFQESVVSNIPAQATVKTEVYVTWWEVEGTASHSVSVHQNTLEVSVVIINVIRKCVIMI